MSNFGKTLDEMDIEAFLNMRDWFEAAIEKHGGKVIDGGMGFGRADIGVELDGVKFGVQIRPRPIRTQPKQNADGGSLALVQDRREST